ncbi:MAG: DNA-3-methyladenine glycosylase [bacterium]
MPHKTIPRTAAQPFFNIIETIGRESDRLDRRAFNQPTLRVAHDLLGKFIVRSSQGRRVSAMIIEVEAYKGPKDRASHAYAGRRTPRVEPLYGDGGTVYVYLVYGLHCLLNFSTAGADIPEGVLVRGILAGPTAERKPILGPGRVSRYLRIDKRLDGTDVTDSKEMWLEDRGIRLPARCIRKGPRIGVDYAGPYWAARPWRFWIDVGSIATRK